MAHTHSVEIPSANLAVAHFEQAKAIRYFYYFVFTYLLIWTFIPAFSYQALPRDVAEELMWGYHWQLGYFKHPFLTSWIVKAYSLVMPHGDWPYYLLSQLAIFICFFTVWKLARKIVNPFEALLSILLLSLSYYYNAASIEFNPNVLMLPLWALSFYFFYQALQKNLLKDWLLTGLWVGCSLITKYETAVLIATMGLIALWTKEGRQCLKSKGPYLSGLISLLIFLPNIIWVMQNNFEPIRYFLERINKTNSANLTDVASRISVLRFLGSQLLIQLPVILTFIPLLRCPSATTPISTFDKKFLLIGALGPVLLTSFVAFILGADLHDNWGTPFFSLFSLLLISYKRPIISTTALRQSLILFSLFSVGIVLAVFIGINYGPKFSEKFINRAHYPAVPLAEKITTRWHEKYAQPLKYIAGDYDLVNYITHYSKDKPLGYSDWDKRESPWIDETDLRKNGGMFVWIIQSEKTKQLPEPIRQRFPNAIMLDEISLNYITPYTAPTLRFGVALLPPP